MGAGRRGDGQHCAYPVGSNRRLKFETPSRSTSGFTVHCNTVVIVVRFVVITRNVVVLLLHCGRSQERVRLLLANTGFARYDDFARCGGGFAVVVVRVVQVKFKGDILTRNLKEKGQFYSTVFLTALFGLT